MPFVDVAFVCDRSDSSEGANYYSELLNMFFDLDRMEARDFYFFLLFKYKVIFSSFTHGLLYKYHQK